MVDAVERIDFRVDVLVGKVELNGSIVEDSGLAGDVLEFLVDGVVTEEPFLVALACVVVGRREGVTIIISSDGSVGRGFFGLSGSIGLNGVVITCIIDGTGSKGSTGSGCGLG